MTSHRKSFSHIQASVFFVAVALLMLGFGASNAPADDQEPIVGLWQITLKDSGGNFFDSLFSGWTREGLEFDQSDMSPILTGNVCYGKWIKLGDRTYGLTHPFYNYAAATGVADGTSGYFNNTVTVSKDGNSFTGKENFKVVAGLNPYDPTAKVLFTLTGLTLSATKIEVDKSLLP